LCARAPAGISPWKPLLNGQGGVDAPPLLPFCPPGSCKNIRLSSDMANPLNRSRNSMVTDGRFARATGQRCDGLHRLKPALARIVERSRLRSLSMARDGGLGHVRVGAARPGMFAAYAAWSAREIELHALLCLQRSPRSPHRPPLVS